MSLFSGMSADKSADKSADASADALCIIIHNDHKASYACVKILFVLIANLPE